MALKAVGKRNPELRAAAAQWCAIGLFSRVTISTKDDNVIAVLQFSANGAQACILLRQLGDERVCLDHVAAGSGGGTRRCFFVALCLAGQPEPLIQVIDQLP